MTVDLAPSPFTATPPALEGRPWLCLGVSWQDRTPHLTLRPINDTQFVMVPLVGRRVGLRVVPGKVCAGRIQLDGPAKGHLPCPSAAAITRGSQCPSCSAEDQFRFAHHAHRGGYVPDALQAYLQQQHWVYIATFADGASKVGTAADLRKLERLDEQGAVRGTYIARTADGLAARVLEDAVTAVVGLTQVRRRAAKTAALTRPLPASDLDRMHADAVRPAAQLLRQDGASAAVALPNEPWDPPAAAGALFATIPAGGWSPYPHRLEDGDHGWTALAMSGQAALATLGDDPDQTPHVLDLGALKGRLVHLGDFTSPPTHQQDSLF